MSATINLFQHSKGSTMKASVQRSQRADGTVAKWLEITVTNAPGNVYGEDTVSIWPSDRQDIMAMLIELQRCVDDEFHREYDDLGETDPMIYLGDESNGQDMARTNRAVAQLTIQDGQLALEEAAINAAEDQDCPF